MPVLSPGLVRSAKPSRTQPNSAEPTQTQLNPAEFSRTQLNSAELSRTHLNSAKLSRTQPTCRSRRINDGGFWLPVAQATRQAAFPGPSLTDADSECRPLVLGIHRNREPRCCGPSAGSPDSAPHPACESAVPASRESGDRAPEDGFSTVPGGEQQAEGRRRPRCQRSGPGKSHSLTGPRVAPL